MKRLPSSDIPTGVIKENAFNSSFNNSIDHSKLIFELLFFELILELVNTTPVFKRVDRNSKEDYRSVSILSSMSKIFEKCIFRKIFDFMVFFLGKQQ